MSKEVPFKPETIEVLTSWKKTLYSDWKHITPLMKLTTLLLLIEALAKKYNKPVEITLGDSYCYNTDTKTILLDRNHPSIISTLHEFGHHILGTSELKACRWSIHLFKTCFPELFKKLSWEGHMLKKN